MDFSYSLSLFSEMDTINFSRIHFNEQKLDQTSSIMIIKIKDNEKGSVSHTPTLIDRCCKRFMVEPSISSIKDKIPRAPCNMTKEEFYLKYVQKRKSVILRGCQKQWRARNWTFEGILQLNSYFLYVNQHFTIVYQYFATSHIRA